MSKWAVLLSALCAWVGVSPSAVAAPPKIEQHVVVYGDFDGDGALDRAEGTPGRNESQGEVRVVYADGRTQLWKRSDLQADIGDEDNQRFGSALASGDLNGDGIDDLAIGCPNAHPRGQHQAGIAFALMGQNDGLSLLNSRYYEQKHAGVGNAPEVRDHFGTSLAIGDIDGDGSNDLAIGVPGETITVTYWWFFVIRVEAVGVVDVFFNGDPNWSAELRPGGNIPGSSDAGDHYGDALAFGDFNGDGIDDLAVGCPDDAENNRGGRVYLTYGADNKNLSHHRQEIWGQGGAPHDLDTNAAPGERFGITLAAGRFNEDEYDDLAVGVPGNDGYLDGGYTTVADVGVVQMVYGSGSGLTGSGNHAIPSWFLPGQASDAGAIHARNHARFGNRLAVRPGSDGDGGLDRLLVVSDKSCDMPDSDGTSTTPTVEGTWLPGGQSSIDLAKAEMTCLEGWPDLDAGQWCCGGCEAIPFSATQEERCWSCSPREAVDHRLGCPDQTQLVTATSGADYDKWTSELRGSGLMPVPAVDDSEEEEGGA